jgi:hypothetical protein
VSSKRIAEERPCLVERRQHPYEFRCVDQMLPLPAQFPALTFEGLPHFLRPLPPKIPAKALSSRLVLRTMMSQVV